MEYNNIETLKEFINKEEVKDYLDKNLIEVFNLIYNLDEGWPYKWLLTGDFINLLLSMKGKYTPNCWVIISHTLYYDNANAFTFMPNSLCEQDVTGTLDINKTDLYDSEEEAEEALDEILTTKTLFRNKTKNKFKILGLIK